MPTYKHVLRDLNLSVYV